MQSNASDASSQESPPIWRWVVGFLLVGLAWGFTPPFMRRAAVIRDQKPTPPRPYITDPKVPWVKRKVLDIGYTILDLLKNPGYAIPLLLNITGSVWFFLLIGEAGMSPHHNTASIQNIH